MTSTEQRIQKHMHQFFSNLLTHGESVNIDIKVFAVNMAMLFYEDLEGCCDDGCDK